jgi:dipeptidyl aminopeptidase/acylaminoacyl peptidase
MRRVVLFASLIAASTPWVLADQRAPAPAAAQMLTVDSIMRGPKLVGNPPSAVRWSRDSARIYFSWQKPDEERSSTWTVNRDGTGLRQLSEQESRTLDTPPGGRLDGARRRVVTAEGGDIVIYDVPSGARQLVTRTSEPESNPRWARGDRAITFVRANNLFLMSLENTPQPALVQLTDIVAPPDPPAAAQGGRGAGGRGAGGGRGGARGGGGQTELTDAQRWLRDQERELIEFIRRQQEERERGGGRGGRGGRGGGGAGLTADPIPRFPLNARQSVADLTLSEDEQHVWIGITERPEQASRGQDTPTYVTESAYPEMIPGRSNVGDVQTVRRLAVLDRKTGKPVWADASAFAGVERKARADAPDVPRTVDWSAPDTSDDGSLTVFAVRAQDNKDRWLVRVDPATGRATVLDHLHDEAWIRSQSVSGGAGGFGAGGAGIAWLPDSTRFVFLAEKDGWMHFHSLDASAATPQARQLTTGAWEVTSAQLSTDRTKVFLTTNEVHPGERHFYTMSVDGGARTKVTALTGSNSVTMSPDERTLAVIHSYSTRPPELHVMPFEAGAKMTQVTTTPIDEWRNFKWIDPKVITYKARDGQDVYARLYTPEMIGARRDPRRPAVVFVHGAGYLQNAHKYWSTYYREYMFHNLLASRGYVVLDPDYRASSGYGRDWRTAIYRHMGGHDLNDVVDGAKYLVSAERIDPRRIGVYGGSYGGFITLMAMFTTPDVFAAGAALRPVTDWAHYNHGYTSNILNTPVVDPEAFKKSSPIYFADGLKGRLLIAHGMVDTNVFFQDSIRLVQRLIELRKENWELAPYPVENHGFTEETSWADEYKRILRLFEEALRQ